ncbi:UNVERIFIED_CONTAM: hypothetical protein RMT77_018755 [Armadillidium vulgare]
MIFQYSLAFLVFLVSPLDQTLTKTSADISFPLCEEVDELLCGYTDGYWNDCFIDYDYPFGYIYPPAFNCPVCCLTKCQNEIVCYQPLNYCNCAFYCSYYDYYDGIIPSRSRLEAAKK